MCCTARTLPDHKYTPCAETLELPGWVIEILGLANVGTSKTMKGLESTASQPTFLEIRSVVFILLDTFCSRDHNTKLCTQPPSTFDKCKSIANPCSSTQRSPRLLKATKVGQN